MVEIINPSIVSFTTEEEGTFHGYMCDGCLIELQDKKIIEAGPEKNKEELNRPDFCDSKLDSILNEEAIN